MVRLEKKVILMIFCFGLTLLLYSQSRVPGQAGNWLQVTGAPGSGSYDGTNITFFEVSDTVTGTLYFAVNNPRNYQGGAGLDEGTGGITYFDLIGGDGCLSNPDSRRLYYSATDITNGVHKTGSSQLQTITITDNADIAYDGWVYFAGVVKEQGEKIGNKYYFKIVTTADAGVGKNAYQLDVSYNNTVGSIPTGVADARAFGYSWCIALDKNSEIFYMYPFVPENDTGYIVFTNFDFDDGSCAPTGEVFIKSQAQGAGTPTNPPITISADGSGGNVANTSYAIPGGETNGTWKAEYNEGSINAFVSNTGEVWFWRSASSISDTTTIAPASALYRTYAEYYVPPPAHHIYTTYTDGIADMGDGSVPAHLELVTFQVVDTDDTPLPYRKDLYVTVSGSALIRETNTATGLSTNNVIVATGNDGIGWIKVSNPSATTTTVTVETDGPGAGSSAGDSLLPGANNQVMIVFQTAGGAPPVMSSASTTTFNEGLSQVLPVLTLTENGSVVHFTAANDIYIGIPDGLNAYFNPINPTFGGTASGRVNGTTPVTYLSLNKVVRVNLDTGFLVSETLTLTGLELTSVNSASVGYLELSYSGAAGPFNVTDDKKITIAGYAQYVWNGSGGATWSTAASWTPNTGVPDTNIENAVIQNVAPNPYPVLDAGVNVFNLSLAANTTLNAGSNNLRVYGSFSNNGTLFLNGTAGSLTLDQGMDTNSGLVEYQGTGGNLTFPVYYNLRLNGSGIWVAPAGTLTINGSLVIEAGNTLDLSTNNTTLHVTGIFSNNGTLALDGVSGTLILDQGMDTDSGTIEYQGAGDNLDFSAYYNLRLNGSGNWVSPAGTLTVNGGLVIESGNTLDIGTDNLHVAGTFSNNGMLALDGTAGTLTLDAGMDTDSGTVEYQGTGAALGFTGYYNLSLNGSGDWVTPGGTLTVNGGLAVESGNTLDVGSNNLHVVGTFSNNDTLYLNGTAGTLTLDAGMDTDSGTVEYQGTGATLGFNGYYNLNLNGSGNWVTPAGTLTVNGSLVLASGNTLNVGSNSLHVVGTFSNNDTLYLNGTAGTLTLDAGMDTDSGIVEYQGTGGTLGFNGYYSLNLNGSGNWTAPAGTLTINGDLVIENGNTLDLSTNNTALHVYGSVTLNGTASINMGSGSVVYESPVTLAGDLTVNNADVTFNDTVTIQNSLTISTGAGGAGNINLAQGVSGSGTQNLTLESGTGSITLGAPLTNLNTVIIQGASLTAGQITTAGSLTLRTDDAVLNGQVDCGGDLNFYTRTGAAAMGIGGAAGAFLLSDTELANINSVTGTIRFGEDGVQSAAIGFQTVNLSALSRPLIVSTSGAIDLDEDNGGGTQGTAVNNGSGALTINADGALTATALHTAGGYQAEIGTTGQITIASANSDVGSNTNRIQFIAGQDQVIVTSTGGNLYLDGVNGLTLETVTTNGGNCTVSTRAGNIVLPNNAITAGAGTITIDAGGAINGVMNDGTPELSAATITLGAHAGGIGTGTPLDLAPTTVFSADTGTWDNGNILIDVIGAARVAVLDAGTGNITLNTTVNVVDTNGAAVNITGNQLTVAAATGIDLDTDITTLVNAVNSGAGNIDIQELDTVTADGLVVTSFNATNVTGGIVTLTADTGNLSISNWVLDNGDNNALSLSALTGTLTYPNVDIDIGTGAGAVLTLYGAADILRTGGGNHNFTANSVLLTSGSSETLTTAAGTLTATINGAGNSLTVNEADALTVTTVNTTNGNVTLTTGGAGNITVGSITAGTGTVSLNAAGTIVDSAVDAATDITAAGISLTAGTGIGAGANLELELANTASLDITTVTGDVILTHSGANLVVNTLNITGGAGNITFNQGGGNTLTVTASASNNGNIQITNADGLFTARTVTAGGAGNITLGTTTGGDISVDNITAAGSQVTINSAAGIADYGSDAGVDITAVAIDLNTAGGIGAADILEISGQTLTLDSTAGGNFSVANTATAAVVVNSLVSNGGAGAITFSQTGGFALNVVSAATQNGTITLSNVNNTLTAAAVNAQGAGADVVLTTTTAGDILVENVQAQNLVQVNSAARIEESGADAGADITALTIDLNAATGIGALAQLEITGQTLTLDVSGNGNINADNLATASTAVNTLAIGGTGSIVFDQTGGFLLDAAGVSVNNGNLTITGADINLDSIGASGVNGVTGSVNVTAGGIIILDGRYYNTSAAQSYLSAAGGTRVLLTGNGEFRAGAGGITCNDMYLYFPGFTLDLYGNIQAHHFVFYNGTLNLQANTVSTNQGGGGDFVVFGGSDFNDDDTTAADTDQDYPGRGSLVYDPLPANYGAVLNGNACAIAVGTGGTGNFYVNGANLNNLGIWSLTVQDNSNADPAADPPWGLPYALAFNLNVADCQTVTGGAIAAAANLMLGAEMHINHNVVDGGNNHVAWDFTALYIESARTISDSVIEITFSEPPETANNALDTGIVSVRTNNNTLPFTTCTSTADPRVFLITDNTTSAVWNTDATGASAGDTASVVRSMDFSGTTRNVVPDLSLVKGTFYDSGRNKMVNYNYNGFSVFNATEDNCRPVLVHVYAGKDAHDSPAETWDAHNYLRLVYSEPVTVGNLNLNSTTPNIRSTVTADAASPGGYIYELAGNVIVTGLFQYNGETLTIGSRYGSTAADLSINALRTTGEGEELYLYIAGYRDGGQAYLYPGYISNATDPENAGLTVTLNNFIVDHAAITALTPVPNILDHTLGATQVEDDPANALSWDVDPPQVAPYPGFGGSGYEIVTKDQDSNTLIDRIEFHILDNSSEALTWDSTSDHPDAAMSTSGVRDATITDLSVFTLNRRLESPAAIPGAVFLTSVDNILFDPIVPSLINTANDPYFSITFTETGFTELDELEVTYDSITGRITDLAGNLLPGGVTYLCLETKPPQILYSLAAVGGNRVYIKFSEPVFGTGAGNTIQAADFQVNGQAVTNLQVVLTEEVGGNSGAKALYLVTDPAQPITANNSLSGAITLTAANTVRDAAFNWIPATYSHPVTDIGLGVVIPAWATDTFHQDSTYGPGFTALTDFTGSGKLMDSDITLQVSIQASSFTGYPAVLYFDIDPADSTLVNGFWLPDIFPEFNSTANNQARILQPAAIQGALRTYVIPASDPEITSGKELQFLIKLGNLYCARLTDSNDLLSLTPWKIKIQDIERQAAGVTILNNVINPLNNEKTIITYPLAESGMVNVTVFGLDGEIITVLHRGRQGKGNYTFSWDGKNRAGRVVARGVYFIKVLGPGVEEIRKVLVVK